MTSNGAEKALHGWYRPSDVASDTFTLGETRVLVDCAYVAGSGRANEAAVEILAQLQSVVHQDAAALLAWDPLAGEHVVLGNSAYDAATLVGLGEPYAQNRAPPADARAASTAADH